jgi:hypothetical protein
MEEKSSNTNLVEVTPFPNLAERDRQPAYHGPASSSEIRSGSANLGIIAGEGRGEAANAMLPAIVANWPRMVLAGLSGKTYARIMQFARYQDGWRGPGSKALTSEALKAFLDFRISLGRNVVEPAIALTARGTLQAQWFFNNHQYLDLEFVSIKKIFFALFDQKAIYEGVDALDKLSRWLSEYPSKPLKWRSRQK